MSNDYFRYAANILPGSTARSQPITQTFEAIARAFELLPNPIDDGVTRGFSQSVQVGPAQQNNQAVTLGQMLEAIAEHTGSDFDQAAIEQAVNDALAASQDAEDAYQSAQGVLTYLLDHQATAPLLGLAIGSANIDSNGDLLLTIKDPSDTIQTETLAAGEQAQAEIVTETDGTSYLLLRLPAGEQGPQGIQGPKGDVGPALNLLGELASTADLPATGSPGDGYLIDGHLWAWEGTQWLDNGSIKGPKGDPSTTDYTELQNVPATFPPGAHSHDDLYYRKAEVDTKLASQSTHALTVTLSAHNEAPTNRNWVIYGSASSRHVGGAVTSFEVTWWDSTTETVAASGGNATLSKQVDQPIGNTVTATVRTLDDIGNASAAETVTATVVDTYIAAPSVTSPLDGATDVPEQPVIEGSAFSMVNGSDTHAATSVRIKDDAGATVWLLEESTTLDTITVPEGILEEGARDYTIDIRHHGATYGVSAWSAPITVTTSVRFIPDFEAQVGEPYGGGYVAGKIVSDYDGLTYGLIVSDGGGDSVQQGAANMEWRTAQASVTTTGGVPPMTLADGRANHNAILALNDLASFPAFKWIEDNCNAGAGLNGHTDWYLPSREELEIIYRNFKPTTQDTNDGTRYSSGFGGDGLTHGTNANSIPEGAGYTLTSPSQTAQAAFQEGGADAFEDSTYWSSTEGSDTFAWYQSFVDGNQGNYLKDNSGRLRAVRRIAL